MDSSKIKALIIVIMALFFALYLGVAAATAQMEAIVWVGSGLFLTLCLVLGRHIWILIPATLGMQGGITFLPGMPAPWQLMTLVVGFFFVLRLAMRKQSLTLKWGWLETSLLLVAITIIQAFIRNPVGLSVLGGDVAGGKPYFIFTLAFAAYALIVISKPDLKTWKWAVILYITFTFIDGFISALSAVSPEFAMLTARFYGNVSLDAILTGESRFDLGEARTSEFQRIGSLLGLIACTFWRPMAALDFRRPWQFVIAVTGAGLILLSGFRGAIARLAVSYIVGSLIRGKVVDVFVTFLLGFLLLIGLVAGGFTTSLPYGVQRSLSFLPIEVDSDVEMSARGSADARFEMWALALGTDRYIRNKVLGDGFNISARELKAREDRRMGDVRASRSMSWMEQAMEMGSYHGFHVETIRFTGAIGLFAATLALIFAALLAWRTIQAHRGTPHWGFILFICMPMLIHPFWYWLVFGAYRAYFPEFIVMAAMVKVAYAISNVPVAVAAIQRTDPIPASPRAGTLQPTMSRSPGGA